MEHLLQPLRSPSKEAPSHIQNQATSSLSSGNEATPSSSDFIEEPEARIIQCVKVLCSSHTAFLKNKLLEDYIRNHTVEDIVHYILKLLGKSFFKVLETPQHERAEAVDRLSEITADKRDRGVYTNVLRVPTPSPFWVHASPMLEIDEAFVVDGAVPLTTLKHMEAKENLSSFHYIAWNASKSHKFVEIAKAGSKDPAALIRIVEAMVVACLYTYTEVDYSQLLKLYEIIDPSTSPYGLNRTSALKDRGLSATADNALSWVFMNVEQESYRTECGGCYHADDVKALFMKEFSDGRSISRGILTFTERTSAKQNADSDRMNSPLHGLYYLFAREYSRQATMVRVRCGKCKTQELNDIDAIYEISTGNYIVRTFMCRTCPKSKNGRSPNKYHFPIDNYTSTTTWESLRAAYKAAIEVGRFQG
ncbi:hypothetical protein MMC15_002231 [Xylographa vitiligo]|nr:hypothetical protein [Xylographa vitiligo]